MITKLVKAQINRRLIFFFFTTPSWELSKSISSLKKEKLYSYIFYKDKNKP